MNSLHMDKNIVGFATHCLESFSFGEFLVGGVGILVVKC